MDAIINDLTTFPVNSMCVPWIMIPSAIYIQLLEKLLCCEAFGCQKDAGY